VNQAGQGGPLSGEDTEKSLSFNDMRKSFRIVFDNFDAEVSESKKHRTDNSQIGKFGSATKTWEEFLKARSFKA
jgi:hypothetical protein